jgi:hypothetical protein
MNIVFIALTNTLIGTLLTIKWKRLRTKGLHPVSALGLFCFGIPLWLLTFIALNLKFTIVYSDRYIFYVLLWSALVILTNLGSIYLMKFQTLSEMTIYKLGISTALGFVVDSLIFKTSFSFPMMVGIFFLFLSGMLLSKNKKGDDKNMLLVLSIVLILSILGIFQISIYKYALSFQPSPLIHGVISQLVIYICFSFFAYRYLHNDYRLQNYRRRDMLDFSLLIFLFTVTEAFLIQALPLTIIILLSVMSLLIYAIYDIYKKEIIPSRQLYLAGVLSLIALVMINSKR